MYVHTLYMLPTYTVYMHIIYRCIIHSIHTVYMYVCAALNYLLALRSFLLTVTYFE